jgi:hypothetical protein
MTTPYSYVIHIHDEENPLRISARHLDEEAQLYTRKPEEAPRRKKRCWEPPVFFSLSEFFLSPAKKAKNY